MRSAPPRPCGLPPYRLHLPLCRFHQRDGAARLSARHDARTRVCDYRVTSTGRHPRRVGRCAETHLADALLPLTPTRARLRVGLGVLRQVSPGRRRPIARRQRAEPPAISPSLGSRPAPKGRRPFRDGLKRVHVASDRRCRCCPPAKTCWREHGVVRSAERTSDVGGRPRSSAPPACHPLVSRLDDVLLDASRQGLAWSRS